MNEFATKKGDGRSALFLRIPPQHALPALLFLVIEGVFLAIIFKFGADDGDKNIYVTMVIIAAMTLVALFFLYFFFRPVREAREERSIGKEEDRGFSLSFEGLLGKLYSLGDKWSDEFSKEINDLVELFNTDKATQVDVRVYTRSAIKSRKEELESFHLLYATEDSVEEYYKTNNWINTELQPKSGRESRKRILIVERNSLGDKSFQRDLASIVEKLDSTSDLKVIWDSDLTDVYPTIVRDMGIFLDKDEKMKGFLTFAQTDSKKILSLSPGSYWIIDDYDYLRKVISLFKDIWVKPELQNVFEDRKERVLEFVDVLPTDHFEWAVSENYLNRNSFKALFSSKIPAIRIEKFAEKSECEAFVEAVREVETSLYNSVTPNIQRIGIPLFEMRGEPKSAYFNTVNQSKEIYEQIVKKSGFDPVERMKDVVHEKCGITLQVAKDKEYGEFFVGLIRLIEGGALIHVDFAPFDAQGFGVDKVEKQIAWNLFLTQPKSGGECVIYDSLWCDDHESCNVKDNYGYPKSLVKGEKNFIIKPVIGDAVLFNCRNFHEVNQISGDRITVGSFIGELKDNQVVTWS